MRDKCVCVCACVCACVKGLGGRMKGGFVGSLGWIVKWFIVYIYGSVTGFVWQYWLLVITELNEFGKRRREPPIS
ncbi:uncharacterized protein EI90DRAFT_3036292 [Cantharellus anzutake]|uniref:uncharacterized protein n=1 Tax=Cantharellus anzutake TaxID=1750568 RepID=UPI001902DAC8|nr:uncharacterized protein EI90DRAFT_3036292 [Cantharellus anzutake]KAF8340638.1 hypothetical protein EI90DRAFT_3036292 [Cantharellus anzutake]